jgi:hypothetical protein
MNFSGIYKLTVYSTVYVPWVYIAFLLWLARGVQAAVELALAHCAGAPKHRSVN